ncbi:amidohydrolase family protein [Oceanispirochaeta sp.]|jgi:N-acyl-D-amino-acid deacylase|uniref:N-acyl-D-amino-acid deacylase family protein n=1 Tax=Oceanispirochaeta sp. TaxID=2035350 RepID=UPI00262C1E2D|nr:amidohydrolase family protein [Oceanispirochaeta sp.]MDA3955099.1 amidohydrolase family protein [Oceanispirochaeta sp.]
MKQYWLTGGRIADGTGSEIYAGHILIQEDRIIKIQTQPPERDVFQYDCKGALITPGFIDIHSHLDWFTGNEGSSPLILPFLQQGITTAVGGNCGYSVFGFPVSHPYRELLTNNLFRSGKSTLCWKDIDEFADHIQTNGSSLNLLCYVGHGTVRTSIRGYDANPLTDEELTQMLGLLEDNLNMGAAGVSLGLQYEPGIFADKKELKAVAALVASHKKVLAVHPRAASAVSGKYPIKPFGTAHHLLAIQDMIDLAEETGVRLQFSHLIFVGSLSWKSADKALKLFDDAWNRGVDIAFDTFGYSLGASRINVILPEWFRTHLGKNLKNPWAIQRLRLETMAMELVLGFGYEHIRVTNAVHPDWKKYNGMYLSHIARQRKSSQFKTLCDLLRVSDGTAGVLMERYSNPEIMNKMIAHPLSHFQTDAWVEREGVNNPAIYGSLPRIFRLNRENNLLPVEEIVRKMTGAPADRMGIAERGYLKEGYFADLVVLDEQSISDREEKGIPLPPTGIDKVIVNGRVMIEKGLEVSDKSPGRLIR